MITALDTETHLIKPGCVSPKLVCVTTSDENGDHIYLRDDGIEVARELLERGEMIGHNIFFDLCVLAAEDETLLPLIFKAIDEGRIHCTKIRQMIIDNAEGRLKFIWNEETGEYKKQSYHLYVLVMRHLGRDIRGKKTGEDIWRLRYNELDGVPLVEWPEEAREYAIDDAIDTRAVYLAQEEYCSDDAGTGLPGGTQGEIWQTQAAWGLYLMGAWGVRTDAAAVEKLRSAVEQEFAEHLATAQRYKLIRTGKKESRNIAAIREVVEAWYTKHARPMKWTDGGKKGKPQIATDREQLTDVECVCGFAFGKCDCKEDGVWRGLWAVAEVVRLQKLLSTYIRALERGTKVPLNPNYNPIIETFRTSCSQGMKIDGVPMGSNVQNQPRKKGARECFIPRPGNVFAFCDYDTLEMLALAQVCLELFGYSAIAEAAREGQDFHTAMGADMLGIPYDYAVKLLNDGDPEMIKIRGVAKIANFGFAGGMGARTFVSYAKGFGADVSLQLANQLHAGFRRKWVEMKDYFNFVASLVGDGNRVPTVTFPKSKMMRGNVTYSATCNGFFQHRAAMGAKAAVAAVSKECYIDPESALYGCRPVFFIHDEIGMEIPYTDQRASDAAMRLQTVMIDEMKSWCPDVPIAATVVMSRRWLKGAKPVLVDGLLVPSKPVGKKWVHDEETVCLAS